MSFPKIESRKMIVEPFGPPPVFRVGNFVILVDFPERRRRVRSVVWHRHRHEWVYEIETSCSDRKDSFIPYWFSDKLEITASEK
jgi:hypothetical protein